MSAVTQRPILASQLLLTHPSTDVIFHYGLVLLLLLQLLLLRIRQWRWRQRAHRAARPDDEQWTYSPKRQSFATRCYKYCLKINTVEEVIESANYKLFRSLQNPQHRLHPILPPTKPLNHDLRPKGTIIYQIPNYSTELHKRSFIPHSLFQYYWL